MKMNSLLRTIVAGVGLVFVAHQLAAFVPSATWRPYDQGIRLPVINDKKFHFKMSGERGGASQARNLDGNKANLLALHDADQATIVMLRNPLADQAPGANAKLVAMGFPADDGRRGHFKLDGTYNEINFNGNLGTRVEVEGLPGSFGFDIFVPMMRKQVSNIKFNDLTRTDDPLFFPIDNAVSTGMRDLKAVLQEIGGLGMDRTEIAGIGDTACTLSWRNWYRQEKEFLQGVELYAHVGVLLPTGKQRNEDQMFSVALGSDGAFGMPIGVGLNLDFVNTFRAGLNVDFVGYFDKTKTRRVKTHAAQTDFFLMNKVRATKDHGLTWQFHLFLQSYHFIGGFSGQVAYQFVRHDSDKLTPRGNEISYDIINSAKSLQEWNMHNVIFSVNYDHVTKSSEAFAVPQLSAFYKLPVGGKGVVMAPTVGAQFGVNF